VVNSWEKPQDHHLNVRSSTKGEFVGHLFGLENRAENTSEFKIYILVRLYRNNDTGAQPHFRI